MCISRFGIGILFVFFLVGDLTAQVTRKSADECRKQVPRDWGPNFGQEWRHHEAIFWGCRLALPTATVENWQRIGNLTGSIEDLVPTIVEEQELILIEQLEGSMHCYSFMALKKFPSGWERVWDDSSSYCTMGCPRLRMKVQGGHLNLYSGTSAEPQCVGMFHRAQFVWNGKTFEATALH
jgi:hypothetical protein